MTAAKQAPEPPRLSVVSLERSAARHHERTAVAVQTKLDSISALHQPKNRKCVECSQKWPCRTARILGVTA